MDLPLALTVSRFVFAPVILVLLLADGVPWRFPIAFVLYCAAAATDWADGKIARARKQTTPLGAFLDPLADKVLVLLLLVTLEAMDVYPLWLVLCMLAREIVNDALRGFAAGRGAILPANSWGKLKTASQMLSLGAALFALAAPEGSRLGGMSTFLLRELAPALLVGACVAGVIGTVLFFARNMRVLRA